MLRPRGPSRAAGVEVLELGVDLDAGAALGYVHAQKRCVAHEARKRGPPTDGQAEEREARSSRLSSLLVRAGSEHHRLDSSGFLHAEAAERGPKPSTRRWYSKRAQSAQQRRPSSLRAVWKARRPLPGSRPSQRLFGTENHRAARSFVAQGHPGPRPREARRQFPQATAGGHGAQASGLASQEAGFERRSERGPHVLEIEEEPGPRPCSPSAAAPPRERRWRPGTPRPPTERRLLR